MKQSQEYKERKELLELKQKLEQEKHQYILAQLMFQRKTNEIYHQQSLERLRIKSAEIKKTQMRKGY